MKNKENTKYPLLYIEWTDSVLGFQGWKVINENIKNHCTKFISVGFLVHSDKEKIILFPHIENSKEDNIAGSGDIVIPISAILKMVQLKY